MATYKDRRWLAVKNYARLTGTEARATASPSASPLIRVGTWNLLAQSLALRERYPYCSKKALDYGSRLRLTLGEISDFRPDILALQEVEPLPHYLETLGRLGYASISRERPMANDGCAILYREDMFTARSSLLFNLDDDSFAIEGRESDANGIRTKGIGIFAVLVHKETSKSMIVGSGHMYWHPNAGLVRLRQWLFYMEMLQKLHAADPDSAVILAADFNTRPDDFVCSLISGRAHPEVTSAPRLLHRHTLEDIPGHERESYEKCMLAIHQSESQPSLEEILGRWSKLKVPRLMSIYPTCMSEAGDSGPRFTSLNARESSIDHIFIDENHFRPIALLETPSVEECTVQVALPNDYYPSDHVSLGALISLV